MQIFKYAFLLLGVVLLKTSVGTKICNPEYLKKSMVMLGDKENFYYYPFTVFEAVKGLVSFVEIKNQVVKEICKNYLSEFVMEVIFVNIGLDYIEPGFFESNNLQQVYIGLNNLKRIEKGVFSNTTIKSLVLSENKIDVIDENAFENMPQLEAIALDFNNIKIFDPNWFNGAKSLYEISIDHNNITEVPEGATKNMVQYFDKDPSSRIFGSIDFDNNDIKFIHSKAFQNLKSFGVISLSNNDMLLLTPSVFNHLDFLFNLYMNTNRFICFSNKTIGSLHGVKRLFVARNQFNKECVLLLQDYFDSKNDVVFF